MFTWTTVALNGYSAYSDMYMDTVAIASNFVNAGSAEGSYSSSNTVFIHCKSASQVYIQCVVYDCQFRSNSDVHASLQSFSGYLVKADD